MNQWRINNMENVILNKSFEFAVSIVKMSRWLQEEKKEYTLSKQILRSGTSIGANITEAQHAQSKADFKSKMSIALKEANETDYWLRLLKFTDYIDDITYYTLYNRCDELIKLLVSIVKNTKK